jgi:hypothetical protein
MVVIQPIKGGGGEEAILLLTKRIAVEEERVITQNTEPVPTNDRGNLIAFSSITRLLDYLQHGGRKLCLNATNYKPIYRASYPELTSQPIL